MAVPYSGNSLLGMGYYDSESDQRLFQRQMDEMQKMQASRQMQNAYLGLPSAANQAVPQANPIPNPEPNPVLLLLE